MLFTDKIKDLRLHSQLPQRKLAAALDIDTATYCKIEKGERKARKDQVELLASVFDIDKKELLALWLADKVTKLISEDGQVARNALSLAVENLEQNDEVKSI
ncbi:MAG: helix-turn-helix domain-containing protein [Bacteroidales bacterium]|nr:helix-turn-helix domain-containing protein [Bacteroidales bacterium]